MRHPYTMRPPRATKLGLCILLVTALLMVSVFVLVNVLVELFSDAPPPPPVPDGKGGLRPSFARSLFVPSYASGSEAVIDVANTNFTTLHASGALCPWLVIFYGDGCGHCRSSVPALVRFAKMWAADAAALGGGTTEGGTVVPSAAAASKVVQIAALNCREYSAACRQHRVYGVPTIKLFLPATADDAANGRSGYAVSFTEVELDPVAGDYSDLAKLIQQEMQKYTASISPSLVDQCMDLRRDLTAAKLARLHPNKATTTTTTAEASASGTAPTTTPTSFLSSAPPPSPEEGGVSAQPVSAAEAAPSPTTDFKEERDIHAADIANAFFSTLYHEVALVGFDSAEQRAALVNFLTVVDEALPGLGAGVPLHYLKTKATATASAGRPPSPSVHINVTEWRQTVLHAGIPYRGTPERLAWRTCKGSAEHYRGFPCGMWLLYHSLTANYGGGGTTPEAGSPSSPHPPPIDGGAAGQGLQVLPVILDYARHYFSCKPCREHFLMFKPLPGPTTKESAVLQLWRVHNVANYNLAKVTEGADPLVPKRQFPDAELCPQCISGTSTTVPMRVWRDEATANSHGPQSQQQQQQPVDAEQAITTDAVTFFNETAVTQFLMNRYAWDPTKLRSETTNPTDAEAEAAAAAVVAAAAAARGEETITVHRKPMGVNIMLTMLATVTFVGVGCARVLRSGGRKTGPFARRHKRVVTSGPGAITQAVGTERRR